MAGFCTVIELAEIFGIGERCVRELIAGGLPRSARGKYDIAKCCSWYIQKLKAQANTKQTKAQKQAEFIDLQIEEKQIDISERKGELLWQTEIIEAVQEIIVLLRSEILGAKSSLAVEIDSERAAEIEVILDRELRKVFNQTSTKLNQVAEKKQRTRKQIKDRKI